MIALQLTDFDRGRRQPAEFFPAETRTKMLEAHRPPRKRGPKRPPAPTATPEELERRREICRAAIEAAGTAAELARRTRLNPSDIRKWVRGVRPTPARHVPRLAKIAGVAS